MSNNNLAVVLFQPEIPPNTGNIIRLCANVGCELHLVKPLGFPLEDSKLRRAGLDYHEYTTLVVHDSWSNCKTYFTNKRFYQTYGYPIFDQLIRTGIDWKFSK